MRRAKYAYNTSTLIIRLTVSRFKAKLKRLKVSTAQPLIMVDSGFVRFD